MLSRRKPWKTAKQELLTKTGLSIQHEERISQVQRQGIVSYIPCRARCLIYGRMLKADQKRQVPQLAGIEIYHKSRILYGIYQARKAVTAKTDALVEGYMDVMALHEAV